MKNEFINIFCEIFKINKLINLEMLPETKAFPSPVKVLAKKILGNIKLTNPTKILGIIEKDKTNEGLNSFI